MQNKTVCSIKVWNRITNKAHNDNRSFLICFSDGIRNSGKGNIPHGVAKFNDRLTSINGIVIVRELILFTLEDPSESIQLPGVWNINTPKLFENFSWKNHVLSINFIYLKQFKYFPVLPSVIIWSSTLINSQCLTYNSLPLLGFFLFDIKEWRTV